MGVNEGVERQSIIDGKPVLAIAPMMDWTDKAPKAIYRKAYFGIGGIR
jgi:hypothetical protein